ncbi:MAG: MFS transporter [Deltaproteobacteria bacterium]|nr:MFS transporter [Deltaproteobacteria bacterium]
MSDAASIWSPPRARLTLGLVLVVVATAFEALAVATVLPATTAELDGLAWYGWTFSAFMLANLVGITVGGGAADRGGPARPFVAGTVLFAGGLVVSGLAPAMPLLVAGRASQGFGGGLLSAVAYASIARGYATALQPRMLATLSSAWVVPGLVGPALAGIVAEHLGWRWVFLGLAPLPALAAALVAPALSAGTAGGPTRAGDQTGAARSAPGPRDAAGGGPHTDAAAIAGGATRTRLALQLAGGSAIALAGLGGQGAFHGGASVAATMVAGGLAVFTGGLAAVAALSRLLPPGTLVARPGLPAAVATMALMNFAFFGAEAFVPLAIVGVRGAGIMLNGMTLSAAALTWAAGAWLQVRLAGRAPRARVIVGGLGILGAGLAGVATLLVPGVPPWTAVAAWAVAGLGMGLAFTTCSAAILASAPAGEEGAASAALQLAQVLGAALATGLGGAIVATPFAGVPPARGIALVDSVMLAVLAAAMGTARGIGERGGSGAAERTAPHRL